MRNSISRLANASIPSVLAAAANAAFAGATWAGMKAWTSACSLCASASFSLASSVAAMAAGTLALSALISSMRLSTLLKILPWASSARLSRAMALATLSPAARIFSADGLAAAAAAAKAAAEAAASAAAFAWVCSTAFLTSAACSPRLSLPTKRSTSASAVLRAGLCSPCRLECSNWTPHNLHAEYPESRYTQLP